MVRYTLFIAALTFAAGAEPLRLVGLMTAREPIAIIRGDNPAPHFVQQGGPVGQYTLSKIEAASVILTAPDGTTLRLVLPASRGVPSSPIESSPIEGIINPFQVEAISICLPSSP